MRIYTVVTVDDYIPHVQLSTLDRDQALNYAREWAEEWIGRCCKTCAHYEAGNDSVHEENPEVEGHCHEGGDSDISDPDMTLTNMDCNAWKPKDEEITGDAGEIYFNQKEEGSMEYAVSVQASDVEQQTHADEGTRKDVLDLAHSIFNDDGIEEFVPELITFAGEASKSWAASTLIDETHLKAATHAAFGAMLLGLPLKEAVDIVLRERPDILGEAQ
jgi:hypothetical protein